MKRLFANSVFVAAMVASNARAAYVLSNADCPSSRGIQQRLDGLIAEQGSESARAMVDVGEKEIRIELATYGERPRLRVLPNQGTCAEKTDAVALVIAAWLDTVPANSIAAPTALPPLPSLPPPAPVAPPPAPVAPPTLSREGWLGMGALGLRDSLSTTAGVRMGLHADGLWRGLGAVVEAGMPWPGESSLGTGKVLLAQPSLSGLASYSLRKRAWSVSPMAGASFTALVVDGRGFKRDRTSVSPRWSVEAGLRIARAVGRWRPWLGVGATASLWAQKVRLVDADASDEATLASLELPRFQVFVAVGLGVRVF